MTAVVRAAVFVLVLAGAVPAHAQWTRVTEVPASDVFSVWTKGDTIAAGLDTAAVLSTDGGATWKVSARVAPAVNAVQAVRVHHGKLYAGTYGQGMFVSHDQGDTWLPFSQGLVGGIANAQLFTTDLALDGNRLLLATSGAGPWVRDLSAPAGTWSHYGAVFEPNQSSNMNGIAVGGGRLFACAGGNGTVFFRDPGSPDWTLSWLDNVGIVPGLGAITAIRTASRWVVGSNAGVFHSALGQSPWTFRDLALGTLFNVGFALHGTELIGAFGTSGGTAYMVSVDDGANWEATEDQEFVFTYNIATRGNTLYAARFDGLWRRPLDGAVAVPEAPVSLRFSVEGAHPVRGPMRFRFALPSAGSAAIDVFDAGGRRVARLEEVAPAGAHAVAWDARGLAPGVYLARLTAGGRSAVTRFVRVR
jgi:hypothetical protein